MPVMSLGQALRFHAARAQDRAAITHGERVLSRAAFLARSEAAARNLRAAGVGAGDVVALTGPNSPELLAVVFGTWMLGAVPLPLSGGRSVEDMGVLLQLGQPRLAIGFSDAVAEASGTKAMALDALFGAIDEDALPDIMPLRLRIGASGGSTGRSKLIVVDAPAAGDPLKPWPVAMTPDGVHLTALQITDGTGFVMSVVGLASGCHLVLMDAFEPETALALIARHGVDWVAVTPPLMLQIWKLGETVRGRYDLSSLRTVSQYSGAAAPWLKRAWIDWLGPERVLECYGATDSRGATSIDGKEWLQRPGSVGRAQPGCEIAILDEAGAPLSPGDVSDIYMRDLTGRRNFHYLGGEMKTLPGGWETVGDMGWLDGDGYLHVADRRKDVIRTEAGEVFPNAIEGVLEAYEGVRSALVIGLPQPSGSERVHALIDAPKGFDVEELKAFADARLGSLQAPVGYERVAGPLRDTAGKARRSQFKAERTQP